MIRTEKLDSILLSDNVCERFHAEYDADYMFRRRMDLLLPEIQKSMQCEQRGVWHIYNVMDHILHSVEQMNILTADMPADERRLLAYTMFLHDMGKPACRTEEMTASGETVDRFLHHNEVSADIARRVVPHLNFNELDIMTIVQLVEYHDIFLLLKDHPTREWHIPLTEKFVHSFIELLNVFGCGKRNFDYLILVGIADNKAQNPALIEEPLKLIARVRDMGHSRD